MKGFVARKSFLHNTTFVMPGDKVDFGKELNNDFERRGLIKWIDRPEIIMPKETKKKKYVRKSKK